MQKSPRSRNGQIGHPRPSSIFPATGIDQQGRGLVKGFSAERMMERASWGHIDTLNLR